VPFLSSNQQRQRIESSKPPVSQEKVNYLYGTSFFFKFYFLILSLEAALKNLLYHPVENVVASGQQKMSQILFFLWLGLWPESNEELKTLL